MESFRKLKDRVDYLVNCSVQTYGREVMEEIQDLVQDLEQDLTKINTILEDLEPKTLLWEYGEYSTKTLAKILIEIYDILNG